MMVIADIQLLMIGVALLTTKSLGYTAPSIRPETFYSSKNKIEITKDASGGQTSVSSYFQPGYRPPLAATSTYNAGSDEG